MEFNFKGNGDGFDVRLKVNWQSLVALFKAAVATIVTLAGLTVALLSAREIEQLEALLGW